MNDDICLTHARLALGFLLAGRPFGIPTMTPRCVDCSTSQSETQFNPITGSGSWASNRPNCRSDDIYSPSYR